jgi:hypothetical protein
MQLRPEDEVASQYEAVRGRIRSGENEKVGKAKGVELDGRA